MSSSRTWDALEVAIRRASQSLLGEIKAEKMDGTEVIECEALVPAWTKGKYERGDARTHNGQTWKCVQPHDNAANPDIEPGKSPAQWVPFHTKDPKRAKEFIQPTMAEDSYNQDEVCIWNGKVYRSKVNSNAYSPEAAPQNWELVEV